MLNTAVSSQYFNKNFPRVHWNLGLKRIISIFLKAMWNTMNCKRDRLNNAGGARGTHWERVSRSLYVYAPNQNLYTIRISVLYDIIIILKKINYIKKHLKNIYFATNLVADCKKYNCRIINQVAYPFFISNEFIDFSASIWIFSIFFVFW